MRKYLFQTHSESDARVNMYKIFKRLLDEAEYRLYARCHPSSDCIRSKADLIKVKYIV